MSLSCECWRNLKINQHAHELASTITDASACYPYWVSSIGENQCAYKPEMTLWYPYMAEAMKDHQRQAEEKIPNYRIVLALLMGDSYAL